MNINEWITKKSKQQWNNDEFEEYVGLRNGKWNGIIERIFTTGITNIAVAAVLVAPNTVLPNFVAFEKFFQ